MSGQNLLALQYFYHILSLIHSARLWQVHWCSDSSWAKSPSFSGTFLMVPVILPDILLLLAGYQSWGLNLHFCQLRPPGSIPRAL